MMTLDEGKDRLKQLIQQIADESGCRITMLSANWLDMSTHQESHHLLREITLEVVDSGARPKT